MTDVLIVGVEGALQYVIKTLARIEGKVDHLLAKGEQVMADLTALTTQVEQNTEVEASAVALIQGLAAQISALSTDPAALQALADQLNGSAADLAAAVAANTPPPAPAPAP